MCACGVVDAASVISTTSFAEESWEVVVSFDAFRSSSVSASVDVPFGFVDAGSVICGLIFEGSLEVAR